MEDEFWDLEEGASSVNEVRDVPEGFRDWVKENEARIAKAREKGTAPWFLRDNEYYVNGHLPDAPQKGPQAQHEERQGEHDARRPVPDGGRAEESAAARRAREEEEAALQRKREEEEWQKMAIPSTPPHVEEYIPYYDGKIMVSPFHGKDELESNLRLAHTMYDIFGETVYLLPNINPKGPNAHLRSKYIPAGVKEGKNADFLCVNRIWDGKECSFENTPREWNKIKSTLENHFKKAKLQADNYIIQVPEWLDEKIYSVITMNYLRISGKDRWIIICKGNGKGNLYKNTSG